MSTINRLLTCALVIVVASSAKTVAAQSLDDVSLARIRSRVAAGDAVSVTDASKRSISGTFVEVSDGVLQVNTSQGMVSIPATQVAEVRRRGDRPWDAGLIGALVGGLIGVAAGGGCDPNAFCMEMRGPVAALGATVVGGISLLADVAHRGSHTIYRAKRLEPRVDVRATPGGALGRLTLQF